MQGVGFKVYSLGCRVQGVACGVWGSGCTVEGLGLRVEGRGLRIEMATVEAIAAVCSECTSRARWCVGSDGTRQHIFTCQNCFQLCRKRPSISLPPSRARALSRPPSLPPSLPP